MKRIVVFTFFVVLLVGAAAPEETRAEEEKTYLSLYDYMQLCNISGTVYDKFVNNLYSFSLDDAKYFIHFTYGGYDYIAMSDDEDFRFSTSYKSENSQTNYTLYSNVVYRFDKGGSDIVNVGTKKSFKITYYEGLQFDFIYANYDLDFLTTFNDAVSYGDADIEEGYYDSGEIPTPTPTATPSPTPEPTPTNTPVPTATPTPTPIPTPTNTPTPTLPPDPELMGQVADFSFIVFMAMLLMQEFPLNLLMVGCLVYVGFLIFDDSKKGLKK